MATPFPPELAIRQDSKYYAETFHDVAVKANMEGGYVTSRPRTTRPARRIYTTGFTDVDQIFLDAFMAFVRTVGTFDLIEWTSPISAEVVTVRFEAIPSARYRGAGGVHRYDIPGIKLVEA